MSNWTQNNRAHEATWKTLRVLGLLGKKVSFDVAGPTTMQGLRMWIPGESAADRAERAAFYAAQMDDVFTEWASAVYEEVPAKKEAAARKTARQAMADALSSKAKTISQLGVRVDELYKFPSETT